MTDPWQNCNLLSLNEGNFWNNWIKGCFARSREDKSTNIFQTRFFLPAPFWCLLILYGGMLQRYCLIAKAPYNVSQLLAALTLKLLQNNVRGMEIQWNTFFLEYIIHLFCLSWQYSCFFPLSIIDYVSQENIHGNTEFADYANCYLKQRRRASFENLKANYRGILHVF